MTITIETEARTVILPEREAVTIPSPAKTRGWLDKNPAAKANHLYPLFDAVASFAVSMTSVPQGCEQFAVPRDPWIVTIGDDMMLALGPDAFGLESLHAVIRSADNCVLITSGPHPYPYRVAATWAARDRKNVLLIESLPHQQEAWQDRLHAVRQDVGELPVFLSVPQPESMQRGSKHRQRVLHCTTL